MVKKETNTKKTTHQKVIKKDDNVDKKNKIQKVTKKHQDIRQVYQKILIHIKKRKQNPDRLNLAIKEALTLLKTKQNAQYNSAIGSKLLQIILKHGQKDQKEVILLLLAKEDIFEICKSNYGSFIIEKVFRYAGKGKSFKLFKKFFKDNLEILLKKFEYLRSVNAYLNSMDKKLQLELVMNNKKLFQRDEFIINEFIETSKEKFSNLHMSLTYYFLFFNYNKISDDKKQLLTTLIINNLEKALQQNNEVMICLVVLNKLFINMNMKFKKEIIKTIFAENFTKYLEYNSDFIYLLLSLLSRLKDQKVINITVLKNIRLNFNQYFEKVQLAKLLLILLQKNITQSIQREKSLTKNILQEEIIELENLELKEQFITNLTFFQKQVLEENLLNPYFKIEIIKKNLEENSVFSLLYVAIFHIITLDDEYSLFVLQLFRELHHLIDYDLDFNKDISEHFINSNNGSRFVKGIIQSIPLCSKLNIDMVEEFAKQLCELVQKKPEAFIHCKSVFVLIAILENSKHSQQLKKIIENSGQMEVNNNQKGFMILKELMSKQII